MTSNSIPHSGSESSAVSLNAPGRLAQSRSESIIQAITPGQNEIAERAIRRASGPSTYVPIGHIRRPSNPLSPLSQITTSDMFSPDYPQSIPDDSVLLNISGIDDTIRPLSSISRASNHRSPLSQIIASDMLSPDYPQSIPDDSVLLNVIDLDDTIRPLSSISNVDHVTESSGMASESSTGSQYPIIEPPGMTAESARLSYEVGASDLFTTGHHVPQQADRPRRTTPLPLGSLGPLPRPPVGNHPIVTRPLPIPPVRRVEPAAVRPLPVPPVRRVEPGIVRCPLPTPPVRSGELRTTSQTLEAGNRQEQNSTNDGTMPPPPQRRFSFD